MTTRQRILQDARNRQYFRTVPGRSAISNICCAASFIRSGLDAESVFGAKACNESERVFGPEGANIVALAKYVLDIEGLPTGSNSYDTIEAAFGTATGSDVFDGLVNTALQQPFQSSRDTSLGWTSERQVENFKTQRRPRIQHADRLEPLPRGHRANDATLNIGDAETYAASRFARSFQVDGQDIVDDDTGAIIQPALALGIAARDLKLDLVFKIFLANAALDADAVALFHSTHANLNTTAALATATLDAALAAMRTQTENGRLIDTTPGFLIVPPALEGLARRLVRDMAIPSDDNGLTVRSEPRLSAGVVDPLDGTTSYSGSTTTWYLAAADGPTIEVGYIDSPTPQVRTYELTRGRWGRRADVKLDIGAKALDYRGLQSSTA